MRRSPLRNPFLTSSCAAVLPGTEHPPHTPINPTIQKGGSRLLQLLHLSLIRHPGLERTRGGSNPIHPLPGGRFLADQTADPTKNINPESDVQRTRHPSPPPRYFRFVFGAVQHTRPRCLISFSATSFATPLQLRTDFSKKNYGDKRSGRSAGRPPPASSADASPRQQK